MAYMKEPSKAQKKEWEKRAREQEAQMQEMIKNLAESYQEQPENITELLSFGSKFYHYSVRNNMLIYSQNPYATYVQSFKAWKDMGYPTKKGEHGLKVYVPVQATILKTGEGLVPLEQATKEQQIQYKAGEIESTTRTRFKLGTVFDISQTVYPKEKYPQLFFMGFPSEVHHNLIQGLTNFAGQHVDCDVETVDLESISLRGDYSPGIIRLNSRLEDTQKLSTLAHELGHAIMQHDHSKSTAQIELEADALGIMIESYLELEIVESRKRHLAENYKAYREEYEAHPGERATFGEVLTNVFRSFQKYEPDLKQCIEMYIPAPSLQKKPSVKKPEQDSRLTQKEIYEEIKSRIQIKDYAAMHGFTIERVGTYYTLKEHNSVRIDPDRNCFWRNSGIDPVTHSTVVENASGSVIDFSLLFIHNGDMREALRELHGMIDLTDYTRPAVSHESRRKPELKKNLKENLKENLPKKAENMRRAFAYLTKSRYIDQDVVQDFVNQKMLYQDIRGNCVFVAYGKDGEPNFATFRGTLTEKRFLGDVPGNDYTRGFYIDNGSNKVIVTESVIDAMSVMTILNGQGMDYHAYDYLIEAGTGKSASLFVHLKEKPIEEVLLSMDHDVAGVSAMEGVKKKIEEQGIQTKVTYHVPDIERNDWNGELTHASKKLQPMSSLTYLEDKPLPEIHYCAVQSTAQVEERGFRKRGDKQQYRLVENVNGTLQPMDINRNVIYTDPKELEALVPPMYVMTQYRDLAAEITRAADKYQEQLPDDERTNIEGRDTKAGEMDLKEDKISIRSVRMEEGVCMAALEIEGKDQELGIWKRGDQFYVETGFAFDDSLQEHFLNEKAVGKISELMGENISKFPDGILMQTGDKELSQAGQTSPAAFLEQLQKQELKRNQAVMNMQPGMSIEMEI